MQSWNLKNIEIYKQAMDRPSNAPKRKAMEVTFMKMQLLNSRN